MAASTLYGLGRMANINQRMVEITDWHSRSAGSEPAGDKVDWENF